MASLATTCACWRNDQPDTTPDPVKTPVARIGSATIKTKMKRTPGCQRTSVIWPRPCPSNTDPELDPSSACALSLSCGGWPVIPMTLMSIDSCPRMLDPCTKVHLTPQSAQPVESLAGIDRDRGPAPSNTPRLSGHAG